MHAQPPNSQAPPAPPATEAPANGTASRTYCDHLECLACHVHAHSAGRHLTQQRQQHGREVEAAGRSCGNKEQAYARGVHLLALQVAQQILVHNGSVKHAAKDGSRATWSCGRARGAQLAAAAGHNTPNAQYTPSSWPKATHAKDSTPMASGTLAASAGRQIGSSPERMAGRPSATE